MRYNLLSKISIISVLLILLSWGCTKIDITEIGSDLIPAVDNVHTFDTILTVNAVQNLLFNDSTRLGKGDNNILGSINNDPIFGKTKADIFLQLKPTFFPYFFGNPSDTINPSLDARTGFDSVVLCLSFKGFYGDTVAQQKFSVYQLDNNTSNFKDSVYKLDFQPDMPYTNLLGQTIVQPNQLRNYTVFSNRKDSVTNQIRIKLNASFANQLFGRDSTTNPANNAFFSDSIFKTFYKGFAVTSETSFGGNGLFYIALTDPSTRLEVHYRRKNRNVVDTTFSSFPVSIGSTTQVPPSATANYVNRDRAGAEYPSSALSTAVYIQATPGSYAFLNIPGLSTFPNSIIHRAELISEQVPDASNPLLDKTLLSPSYLYLDIKDSTTTLKFKPLYYDLSPNVSYNPDNNISFFPTGGIDFSYFGGFAKIKRDGLGNEISYYNMNISRYVQNMITRRTYNYTLRLSAPSVLSYYGYNVNYNNSIAFGRVRLGSGTHPTQPLRLRIVYSKL